MPFKILPHTSDIRLHVMAPSLDELFREAMRGMFYIMRPHAEKSSKIGGTFARRSVQSEAPDRDALLVGFLNEALAQGDIHAEIYDKVKFINFSDTALKGEFIGKPRRSVETQIKAATLHGLHIQEERGTFQAIIVFDV